MIKLHQTYLLVFCLSGIPVQSAFSQTVRQEKKVVFTDSFPDFSDTLLLEPKIDTTANASLGDFDGDGHLDIMLVKGRHWPIVDRILLGDGRGGVRKSYDLGKISDRSYTGGLADFNADGFLDIAVSNDAPDRKLIYLNDGRGNFTIGSEFGQPKWPTRNLSIADINTDGLPDLILANRGGPSMTNYICLNKGKGNFNGDCISFAPYPSTTITPTDINSDGLVDLVVPHRNGGQSYVYLGSSGGIFSENLRIPFGPANAEIRAAAVADFNGDNFPDIVAIDETKGADLYFGQRDKTFSVGTALTDSKLTPYALAIADLNNDNKADILIGQIKSPTKIFFNGGTEGGFKSISIGDSNGTVYGFAVGDFNEDGIPDIVTARSEGTNVLHFGKRKSINRK